MNQSLNVPLQPKFLIDDLLNVHTNKLLDHLFNNKRLTGEQKLNIQNQFQISLEEFYGKFQIPKKNSTGDDLQPKLKFVFYKWELFKSIFPGKSVARSYISILLDFRNQWAHNDQISYSDVGYAGETLLRLAHLINDMEILPEIDSFCEYIDGIINKIETGPQLEDFFDGHSDVSNLEPETVKSLQAISDFLIEHNLNIEDLFGKLNEQLENIDQNQNELPVNPKEQFENIDRNRIEVLDESIEREIIDSMLNGVFYFNENGYQSLYEMLYDIYYKSLSDFDLSFYQDYGYEKLCNQIRTDQEKDKESLYESNEAIVYQLIDKLQDDIVQQSTCSPGKYPNTLHFGSDSISFAIGTRKLILVMKNLVELDRFINGVEVSSELVGNYKGYKVLCFPSVDKSEFIIGKSKAQLLLENAFKIYKWLVDEQMMSVEDGQEILTSMITYIKDKFI